MSAGWDGPALFCPGCQHLLPDYCTCAAGPHEPPAEAAAPLAQPKHARSDPEPSPAAFQPYDLTRLIIEGVPPPQLLAGNMLYLGGLHSLAGPPDCGKTTVAYWWALDILRTGRPVAIFDEECGPEQAAEKLLGMGAKPDDLAGLAYYPFPGRQRSSETSRNSAGQ